MKKTITDLFEQYIGTHEYHGVVAEIQTWYYGFVYKGAWCASSASFFCNQLGILDQIGGKNENVYEMMEAARKASAKSGKGKFFYKKDIPGDFVIPRGTLIFNLNSGTVMTPTSSKHVTTAYTDFAYNTANTFKGLGGNQSDEIRISEYPQTRIYAIFIPDYPDDGKRPTIKKGYKDSERGGTYCAEMQTDLNTLGYRDADGNALVVDGSCGGKSVAAIKNLQAANGLEVDGSCGQMTWAKIDELLAAPKPKLKGVMLEDIIIKEGTEVAFDENIGDYWHITGTGVCVKADMFIGIKP